jgi:hypothetical protein
MIEAMTNRFAKHWDPPSWRNLFITLPWAIGLVFFLYSSASDHRVAGREQIAYGTIRTHEPANHNRFGYAFSVGGKSYTGWQIPISEYSIGQPVRVYYDPIDPTKSSLNSFSESSDRILGPSLFCAFGIVAVVLVIYLMRRDHERNNRLRNPPL